MTHLELEVAFRSLEARVKLLEEQVEVLKAKPAVLPVEVKEGRSMCPKCGVKPNHYFHVKTCRGKKEE
jgi:hypothetical protein